MFDWFWYLSLSEPVSFQRTVHFRNSEILLVVRPYSAMGYWNWSFDTERKYLRSYVIFQNTDSCINLDVKMWQSHCYQNSKLKNTKPTASGAAKNHFLKLQVIRKYLESALKNTLQNKADMSKAVRHRYIMFSFRMHTTLPKTGSGLN